MLDRHILLVWTCRGTARGATYSSTDRCSDWTTDG